MIRKWIEKKIEARVNEYLATLEVDEAAIAEHVEVDLELVAEHIEASALVDHIDFDHILDNALDYDQVADYVDKRELADHIELYDLADYIDKYEIAEAMDKDYIASEIEVDAQDVAGHIELQDLANWVADEEGLISALIDDNDFVSELGEQIQGRVANAMVEQCQEATNINTDKINALIEAMESIELAVTNMRMAIEEDWSEE